MKIKVIFIIICVTLIVILLSACSSASPGSPTKVQPEGKTLLETRCTVCHSTSRITSIKGTKAEWDQVVTRMIGQGAILTDAEKTVLVKYLADTYK